MATDHLAVLHIFDQDDSDARALANERTIRNAMAALPGAISVGVSQQPVLASGEGYKSGFEHFRVAGRSYVGEGDEGTASAVSVGYFETLQARLLRGRFFVEGDDLTKPRVALINRTMAAQIFGGEDPLGKWLIGEWDQRPVQIIGIVDDLKDGPLDAKPTLSVYRALRQTPSNDIYVTLRTSQPEGAILPSMVRTVHQLDPSLIVDGEETVADRINNGEAAYLHRSAAWLVAGFASLALLLGTVGLYGVISYSVGQRTREIGVRMALGAQRASVYQLILREACGLAVLGVVGGLACSVFAASLMRSILFAVSPWDLATVVSVVSVLAAAALLASFVPARRAASLNPTEALRAE
jgi:predicted permease